MEGGREGIGMMKRERGGMQRCWGGDVCRPVREWSGKMQCAPYTGEATPPPSQPHTHMHTCTHTLHEIGAFFFPQQFFMKT